MEIGNDSGQVVSITVNATRNLTPLFDILQSDAKMASII